MAATSCPIGVRMPDGRAATSHTRSDRVAGRSSALAELGDLSENGDSTRRTSRDTWRQDRARANLRTRDSRPASTASWRPAHRHIVTGAPARRSRANLSAHEEKSKDSSHQSERSARCRLVGRGGEGCLTKHRTASAGTCLEGRRAQDLCPSGPAPPSRGYDSSSKAAARPRARPRGLRVHLSRPPPRLDSDGDVKWYTATSPREHYAGSGRHVVTGAGSEQAGVPSRGRRRRRDRRHDALGIDSSPRLFDGRCGRTAGWHGTANASTGRALRDGPYSPSSAVKSLLRPEDGGPREGHSVAGARVGRSAYSRQEPEGSVGVQQAASHDWRMIWKRECDRQLHVERVDRRDRRTDLGRGHDARRHRAAAAPGRAVRLDPGS